MAYKLEHVPGDHLGVLVETMHKWSNNQPDMYIISEEGHKIYTHKLLISFYSATLASILESGSPADMSGVSILASSNSIVNLLKVLATGIAISNNKADLLTVNKTAEAMGIQMEHWQIGVKNRGGTRVSKNDNKSSIKAKKKSIEKKVPEPHVKQELTENTQEKKFACDDCGKQFGRKDHLTRHALTHSGVSYPCDYCGSSFKRKEGLKLHLSKAHDVDLTEEVESPVNVKVENDDATAQQSVIDDAAATLDIDAHNGDGIEASIDEGMIKAAVFGEVCQDNDDFTAAEGEDPSIEGKFSCNQCEKMFKNPQHLKRHEAVHSGLKFTCNECQSTFSRKDKLTAHMRKKHSSLAENYGSNPLENLGQEVDNSTNQGNEDVENTLAMETSFEDPSPNMKLECPYCQEMVEDLADHCLQKHNNEDDVVNEILNEVQLADSE